VSLRDQLVAKGLASKKDAQRVERGLKEDRKQKQGARERKSVEEARAEAERQAALRAEVEARARARTEAERARDAVERDLRIRRMILDTRVRAKGKQAYWHRRLDSPVLARAAVSPRVASMLRQGELAIVALPPRFATQEPEYVLVPARTARRLLELEPRLVLAFTQDPRGISAPEEAFLEPDWEISLRPHRVGGPGGGDQGRGAT
jgi:uncharacterized protein YaiL (DUF2058 family)